LLYSGEAVTTSKPESPPAISNDQRCERLLDITLPAGVGQGPAAMVKPRILPGTIGGAFTLSGVGA